MSKQFTVKEVGQHKDDVWIIVDNGVYDMSGMHAPNPACSPQLTYALLGFVDEHPGGAKILKRVGGKDATKQFWKYHNEGRTISYKNAIRVVQRSWR